MLVWPEEIDVHRIKNEQFVPEVKPPLSTSVPPLPLIANQRSEVNNASAVSIIDANQRHVSNSLDMSMQAGSQSVRGRQGAATMRF